MSNPSPIANHDMPVALFNDLGYLGLGYSEMGGDMLNPAPITCCQIGNKAIDRQYAGIHDRCGACMESVSRGQVVGPFEKRFALAR